MKTGTVFVLLAFIVMGLEVAWAQKSPVKGEGAEGTPADSREGSEPSVRPEGGFPGSNQVPTAEWGPLGHTMGSKRYPSRLKRRGESIHYPLEEA